MLVQYRQYTICPDCHLKQIFSEQVDDRKYNFLNADPELYRQSRFLRNIRQSYIRSKELTDKQVKAFKETLVKIKKGESSE